MFSFPPDSFISSLLLSPPPCSQCPCFTDTRHTFALFSFPVSRFSGRWAHFCPLFAPIVPFFRTLGTLLPPFRSHRPVFPDVGHTHSNPISSIRGSISGSSAALKLISGSASMLAISSLAALSFSSRLSIATACR